MFFDVDVDALTEQWLGRVQALKVLTEDRTLLGSVVRGWLEALQKPDDATDLSERVALYGRSLGTDGQPASAAVLQGVLLRDILAAADAGEDIVTRTTGLIRILADAHALGSLEREKLRARRARQSAAPVLCIAGVGVIGFVADTADADLVDGVVARVLRECAGRGERQAIIDIGGARREDQLIHRTIAGFTTSGDADRYHLVVTGLGPVSRTRIALEGLNANFERLTLAETLDGFLAQNG